MTQVSVPHRSSIGTAPIVLILTGVVIGLAIAVVAAMSLRTVNMASLESFSQAQAVEGATQADVQVHFGAGNLAISALQPSDDSLSRLRFEGPSDLRPDTTYTVSDGVGHVGFISRGAQEVWLNLPFVGRARDHADLGVRLSPNVPLTLDVAAGAADSDLDLTKLRVTRLDLQSGASDTRIQLPEAAGFTTLSAKAGVGELRIDVPPTVAADIEITNALGNRTVDQTRFRSFGNGHYRSVDYDTATNRVEMRLELGIGDLVVR